MAWLAISCNRNRGVTSADTTFTLFIARDSHQGVVSSSTDFLLYRILVRSKDPAAFRPKAVLFVAIASRTDVKALNLWAHLISPNGVHHTLDTHNSREVTAGQ